MGTHVQTDDEMDTFVHQAIQELSIGKLAVKDNRPCTDQLLDLLNGFEVFQVALTGQIFDGA
jgi:hypothetical protein